AGLNTATNTHVQTPAPALLTLQVVADRTSMSRHLILVLAARGEFPAPTKFSIGAGTANVWREADVHDWISQQTKQVAA
ncbi:MAG: AlpA family phage regulatory protein, partial [Burkholderiaceae bacterium]|nr:AlpA family phage regulatory protein [Burkholderiaceae bacterium]